jgi:hypothetical protein
LADVGRGELEVIAFTETEQPTPEEPDAFATVVALGEARPEAAWLWDTGEGGQLKIRVLPHPDEPMIPTMQVSDGEGEVITLTQDQLRGDEIIELPHGGEWTIQMAPSGNDPDGMASMQVWIMGKERPDPEKLR